MNMSIYSKSFLAFAFIFMAARINAFAANVDSTVTKRFPQAILVQINTEQSRIKALMRSNRIDEADQAKSDAGMASQAMISDFRRNFTFCPVYYYVDTNINRIKNKQFDGILLDSSRNVVRNVTPENYLVCYYGSALTQFQDGREANENGYDAETRSVRGLVVLNEMFKQIAYYRQSVFFIFFSHDPNEYSSKRFDIEYIPLAEKFNADLESESKYRSKHKSGNGRK
jgi:hypothetical protein